MAAPRAATAHGEGIVLANGILCGNKEGANKYRRTTLTVHKRRTQRVNLPRGPRRRKGAQRLGLERDAKIKLASKTGRRGARPAP